MQYLKINSKAYFFITPLKKFLVKSRLLKSNSFNKLSSPII